jgi:hypothetical protein
MKQLTRVILSLVLVGCCAIIARADSVSDSSNSLGDFKVILNDPSCPSGTTCVPVGYDGSSETFSVLFLAPSPIQIPAGQTAACSTNFGKCLVFFPGDGDGDRDDFFYGVLFLGEITPDEDFDIGISGLSNFSLVLPNDFSCENESQCANGIIDFAAAPEPSTLLLLLAGLPLFAILRRRKLRFAPNARA